MMVGKLRKDGNFGGKFGGIVSENRGDRGNVFLFSFFLFFFFLFLFRGYSILLEIEEVIFIGNFGDIV